MLALTVVRSSHLEGVEQGFLVCAMFLQDGVVAKHENQPVLIIRRAQEPERVAA